MPGQNAFFSGFSYIGIGRETIGGYGVYTTAPAALDFLSASIKTMQEGKILEEITRSRTYAQRILMSRKIEGSLDFYFKPGITACGYILQNAMGGTITSATAAGETIGGGAIVHTFNVGEMNSSSYASLCINVRKGDATNGKVWEYSGIRVNELTFSAEIDDALKCSMSFIGADSTQVSSSISSALTVSAAMPLTFSLGRFSIENSAGSLTSSSFWHVQSVSFGIQNSLKAEGRIGSDIINALTPGIASFNLSVNMRFDTLTAYQAMINATRLYGEFEFTGNTIPGSVAREGIKFRFHKLYVNDAGDPEIGGPDDVLKSEVSFHVLRDDSSASGYAVQALLTTTITSFV